MISTPYTENFLRENFTQSEYEKVADILSIQKKYIMAIISINQSNQIEDDYKIMQRRREELMKSLVFYKNQWQNVINPQICLFEKKPFKE